MCGNIFGGNNCSWVIILVLILCCCGGHEGREGIGNSGCGCCNG